MEQLTLDFLSKSAQLILYSRLKDTISPEKLARVKTPKKPSQFQLRFPQPFEFDSQIPPGWSNTDHKLMVLEFFLKKKSTDTSYSFPPKKPDPNAETEKYLVEQWNFELSEPNDRKRKSTVDSYDALYTKLTILMRTISTLTANLPLFRTFLTDTSSSLHQHFTLDYSIHFSFRSLNSWHPLVHEESLLSCYTNQDLVLPGRVFSFKVNYTKHLKFLQKFVQENACTFGFPRVSSNEKLAAMDYMKRTRRFLSDDIDFEETRQPKATAHRHSVDMTRKGMFSFGKAGGTAMDSTRYSPQGQSGSLGLAQWGSKNISEDNHSPMDSIFGTSSPIETQKPPKFLLGGSRPGSKDFTPKELTRDNSQNSEGSSGEYEFRIVENEEDKVTEIGIGFDIPIRRESPMILNAFNDRDFSSKRTAAFLQCSKGKNSLKLSKNLQNIENIIQEENDDKIAEILKIVETMKNISYVDEDSHELGDFSSRLSGGTFKRTTLIDIADDISPRNTVVLGTLASEPKNKTQSMSLYFAEELDELEKFHNELQNTT